jgi:hypothetical protein
MPPVQTNVHTPTISVLVPAASTASSEILQIFTLVEGLFIHGVDPMPSFRDALGAASRQALCP